MDLGYAGIIITATAGFFGSIITALIRLPGRSTNGVAKKVADLSLRIGTSEQKHAETKAHYGDIMRRLDSHETKLDELLKRE